MNLDDQIFVNWQFQDKNQFVILIKESFKQKRLNKKDDYECRNSIKIWKANLKQYNNNIQKENDVLFYCLQWFTFIEFLATIIWKC
jgi:hypothetical protein